MAIPNTPSLLEIRNPLLLQSANSLDSALAQFNKLAASVERNGTSQVVPKETSIAEWLLGPVPDATYQPYASYAVSNGEPESPLFEWATSPVLPPLAWSMPSEVMDLTGSEPEAEQGTTPRSSSRTSNTAATSPSRTAKRPRPAEEEEECSEELLARRAKNTDAARRSRLKKVVRLEGLETKVAGLESTNQTLSTKVAVLETERNSHLVKEAEQMARIAQLEAKLIEAQLTFALRRVQ
ncbi:hypothetical protein BGX29_009256 [Mortierella sp. GBA35]|nr:hypothetical protein BGX23_006176 [Mortierella sp. AD031]KAF9094909.1 hypothetical protein BGX29_009256 [Mortierella sp. GBA35]KAG0207832.1 hypothetical protein BGX33_006610 [Mortierella sp. NVP41]